MSSTATINTQSSSNKATLETMAKNIADNTACLQGILKELKQMQSMSKRDDHFLSSQQLQHKVNKHPQSAPTRTQAFTKRTHTHKHSTQVTIYFTCQEDLLVACGTLFGNTIHRSPAKTSIQVNIFILLYI